MRSIWTGAIGFGLVNIPVKMYSATEAGTIDFDMLDEKDHSNIHFKRVNEKTGKEVDWQQIVKGFKLPNDEYVVLSEADFEAASPKKNKTIEITDFVKESEIDSIYFEAPYYLEPDESGVRAYALLRAALLKTGKAGVATFVLRNRENLAILRATENVIVLNRIRFEAEIRDSKELNLPQRAEIKGAELSMAISLIDQLSSKFDISKYKDTYNAELMKLIKAKAKGKEIKSPKLRIVYSKSEDLIKQLKASLEKPKKAS